MYREGGYVWSGLWMLDKMSAHMFLCVVWSDIPDTHAYLKLVYRSAGNRRMIKKVWAAILVQGVHTEWILPACREDLFPGFWEEVYMELNSLCFNTIIQLPVGCIEKHPSSFAGKRENEEWTKQYLNFFSSYFQAFLVLWFFSVLELIFYYYCCYWYYYCCYWY